MKKYLGDVVEDVFKKSELCINTLMTIMIKFDITERVNKDSIDIDDATYTIGLLDVVEFLIAELKLLLIDETRYYGIVKIYINTIEDSYQVIHDNTTSKDIRIYSRILYLFKPSLRSEFERLCNKKLSPADSTICIIRKILSILEEVPNNTYKKELISIKKIIDKLYENIKTKSKKDSMFFFADHIRKCMEKHLIGKYPLNVFSFEDTGLPQELILEEEEKISLCKSNIFEKKLL